MKPSAAGSAQDLQAPTDRDNRGVAPTMGAADERGPVDDGGCMSTLLMVDGADGCRPPIAEFTLRSGPGITFTDPVDADARRRSHH